MSEYRFLNNLYIDVLCMMVEIKSRQRRPKILKSESKADRVGKKYPVREQLRIGTTGFISVLILHNTVRQDRTVKMEF